MFEYREVEMPENCIFKISPSQISKFFEYPSVWFKEQVLNEIEFTGNTATMIGTVCHHIFECVALNKEVDRKTISKELNKIDNPDIDISEVEKIYPEVATVVVNDYLLKNMPTKVEFPVVAEVLNNVYIGGTVDNLTGSILIDYKIVGSKPNTETIPFHYKIQLLSYAYALKKNNVFVDRIRIVYGVKPTKTLPARVYTVTEQINLKDEELAKETLYLIAETVLKYKECPELAYLLFKSMKLKELNNNSEKSFLHNNTTNKN